MIGFLRNSHFPPDDWRGVAAECLEVDTECVSMTLMVQAGVFFQCPGQGLELTQSHHTTLETPELNGIHIVNMLYITCS